MKPDGVRHADRTIRVAGASHVQSKGRAWWGDRQHGRGGTGYRPRTNAPNAPPARLSRVIVTTAIGPILATGCRPAFSSANPVSDADLVRAIGMALAQIRSNRRPIHVPFHRLVGGRHAASTTRAP
jgi:cell division protein FtsA